MRQATQASFPSLVLEAGTVVVDFSSRWCPPCRVLEAALTEASASRPGLQVVHVDVGAEPALGQQYRIQATPTLIAFQDGRPVATEVGFAGPARLARFLDRFAPAG